MASNRQPQPRATDIDIRDPDQPTIQPSAVDPSVQDGPTEGLSTMSGLFSQPATIVDEVEELPFTREEVMAEVWVIRTSEDIEDMTLGLPIVHMSFKAGVRYKVPRNVAYELARLDYLMEQPFPYDENRFARR